MSASRRNFIKTTALAGSGLILNPKNLLAHDLKIPYNPISKNAPPEYDGNELLGLSYDLLQKWAAGMLALQVNNPAMRGLHGGIMCPACATVHGRCADAIFPFMFMADKTKDRKYVDASINAYEWMEQAVSQPDGSWTNEITTSNWKGITVFTSITLCETLVYFGHLLDAATKTKWEVRMRKAAEYVYKTFDVHYGNINYPITATYALTLIGEYLNEPRFKTRGRELAHDAIKCLTPNDHFIYGEGHPTVIPTVKGCYHVDMGYNVEESLPSLVLYARMTNDQEVLDAAIKALKTHAEFMLPDGGWDNSWGTRNFKWTYWGSRTSDGSQPAYALMSDKDPVFYKIALQNTKQLAACTHGNFLHGGPHYVNHGVQPCIHHAFGHSKALTAVLVRAKEVKPNSTIALPREQSYGVKYFPDIQTWLIAQGKWRGTITGFDMEYTMHAGHATGGALTMLWHPKTGPIIAASMTTYQLTENTNMQADNDAFAMSLTPRFELINNKNRYTNINDLKARIKRGNAMGNIVFYAFDVDALLVDDKQQAYPGASCALDYVFNENLVHIQGTCSGTNNDAVNYILPIISTNDEKVTQLSDRKLQIHKKDAVITIESKTPITILPTSNGRVFNFVPGMEAIPIQISGNQVDVTITVS